MTMLDSKTEEELKRFESAGDTCMSRHTFEGVVEALGMYKKAHSLLCNAVSKQIHALHDVKACIQFKRQEAELKPVMQRIESKMRKAVNAAGELSNEA